MKILAEKVIGMMLLVTLTACNGAKKGTEAELTPCTEVTVTHITLGGIKDKITLLGTTAYLKKTIVTSPIAAFISGTEVQRGSRVHPGQLLYRLESTEHKALIKSAESSDIGLVAVKAYASGIVTDVLQQTGSFVPQGTELCKIADPGSMVFVLSVPYEQMKYVYRGKRCTIVLPDDSRLSATIQTPLATMTVESQVQQVTTFAKVPFLPEGLTVNVLVDKGGDTRRSSGQLIEKKAVQSNETLTRYWLLKFINDTTVVHVPVKVGNDNQEQIEILSPVFSHHERFVLSGGYALEDSARVKITK